MKVFINGELITKEYRSVALLEDRWQRTFRSTRSVDALTEFVKQQLQISINEFPSSEYLDKAMDRSKRNVIAYYHCRDCPEYQNFQVIFLWFPIVLSFRVFRKLPLCYEKIVPSGWARTKH